MDTTIAAWDDEAGALQSMERNVAARKLFGQRTFLIGLLYVITIIVVLAIVWRL